MSDWREGKRIGDNNGRQPKHPINLTGPNLKPLGVLNSLTPNAKAEHNPYITKREPCHVGGSVSGREEKVGVNGRWSCKRMTCEARKTKHGEIPRPTGFSSKLLK